MEQIIEAKAEPKTVAQYKAEMSRLMDAMSQVEKEMESDRLVIERLKVEAQILKAESDLIKARTQERLDTLAAIGWSHVEAAH